MWRFLLSHSFKPDSYIFMLPDYFRLGILSWDFRRDLGEISALIYIFSREKKITGWHLIPRASTPETRLQPAFRETSMPLWTTWKNPGLRAQDGTWGHTNRQAPPIPQTVPIAPVRAWFLKTSPFHQVPHANVSVRNPSPSETASRLRAAPTSP
jgi:hypothetical protein